MPIDEHCVVMMVESLGPNRSKFVWRQYYNPVGLFLKYAFPRMMLGLMNQGMKQLQQKLGGKDGQIHKVM